MAVYKEDLQSFQDFAYQKLNDCGADSLSELVEQWEALRESDQVESDIMESHSDIDANRIKPLDVACTDIRKKLDGIVE